MLVSMTRSIPLFPLPQGSVIHKAAFHPEHEIMLKKHFYFLTGIATILELRKVLRWEREVCTGKTHIPSLPV